MEQEFAEISILKDVGGIDSGFKSKAYSRVDSPVFLSSLDGPACFFFI